MNPGKALARNKFQDAKKRPASSTVTKAAKELGSMGGEARAHSLSSARKRDIAIHAACARWGTKCYCSDCK